MTSCKYNNNRIVPININQTNCLSNIPTEMFSVFLIKNGSSSFVFNGEKCYVSGKAILCFDNTVSLKILTSQKIDATIISFSPEFINVNLNWQLIKSNDYHCLCTKQNYPEFEPFINRDSIYNGILTLDIDYFNLLEHYFNRIEEQLIEQPDNKWSCRTRSYLFKIFGILNFLFYEYHHQDDLELFALKVCDHILLNLNNDISIKKLCELFATNHTTLTRKFKEFTNTTITNYIILKRLENAKYSLSFTSLSLEEIAKQNGFSELSYFTKTFKNKVGITPLKYRNDMRYRRMNFEKEIQSIASN